MPRVRFLADFDYSPAAFGGRLTKAFKAGTVDTVTSECAALAVAAGAAEAINRSKRQEAGGEEA